MKADNQVGMVPGRTETVAIQGDDGRHGEEWRLILGFPDYQASSLGRIMSFRRSTPHILKPTICKDGHLQVELFSNCRRWKVRVGTVVSLVFLGSCPSGSVVKHRDGDRHNNTVSNLFHLPVVNAVQRDFSTGCHPTRLNTESVVAIRLGGFLAHLHAKDAAKLFGVNESTIYKVRRGFTWAWVPGATTSQDSMNVGDVAHPERAVTDSCEQSHLAVTVTD
jgi:hypothetical protein